MFNNANLSFEAAPPIKVVFRFFLTASIFGIFTSLTLFFTFPNLLNIYDFNTLGTIHLITLGIITNFIFGALFQMLPVIAGVSIQNSEIVSLRVNYTLLIGTIFLFNAFLHNNQLLYILASIFLIFSFSYFFINSFKELIVLKHSNSSKGMLYAIISLILVILFATILISFKIGINLPFNFLLIRNFHLLFGLFGLFMILIFSISFQVIEMFYVTNSYPKLYSKNISLIIIITLIVNFVNFNIPINLIAFLSLIHAILTIKLLLKRKRVVSDGTIWFWYLAMGNLILFSLLILLNNFFSINIVLIALSFIFFIFSTIFAMIFKIIPFLVWFQLNRQGYFDGPMMHEVIHPKIVKKLFYLFIITNLSFILSIFFNNFYLIASLMLLIIFIILTALIYNSWHKYIETLKNGMKLDFSI